MRFVRRRWGQISSFLEKALFSGRKMDVLQRVKRSHHSSEQGYLRSTNTHREDKLMDDHMISGFLYTLLLSPSPTEKSAAGLTHFRGHAVITAD